MTDARDIVERLRNFALNTLALIPDKLEQYPKTDPDLIIKGFSRQCDLLTEAADTIASLRKQLEDARGALRQWQEWETKWLVDARCWVTDDGSHIPQDLFDEYVCGPQNAREALKGKS